MNPQDPQMPSNPERLERAVSRHEEAYKALSEARRYNGYDGPNPGVGQAGEEARKAQENTRRVINASSTSDLVNHVLGREDGGNPQVHHTLLERMDITRDQISQLSLHPNSETSHWFSRHNYATVEHRTLHALSHPTECDSCAYEKFRKTGQ